MRILLAEDNLVNQKLVLRMLDRKGYSADTAMNGAEVLSALASKSYDIILMDIHMPKMDGLEATRRIRAHLPGAAQPYIIALTADAILRVKHKCMEAGMDDYVSKPIDLESLLAALHRASLPE